MAPGTLLGRTAELARIRAGLVFVDPRGPRVSEEWLAALPAPASGEPETVTLNREELEVFETDPSLNPEQLLLADSAARAAATMDGIATPFGDRPVAVLSADGTPTFWADLPADIAAAFDGAWAAGQHGLADASSAGTLTIVTGSGHEIQMDQPSAVTSAIEDILAAVTHP